jgi:hypothetical protein
MKPIYHTMNIRWLTLGCLCFALSDCAPKTPPPAVPSHVQNGQLYQSGQSEFDGLFRELYDLQVMLAGAPDEERQIRKTLASALALDSAASRQILADKISARAAEFTAKKLRLKLEIEGLDANDEADAMAQAKVVGTLDESAQSCVEATALAARQELKFAARLRHAQKRLEHLAHHASALDPWIESTFGGHGPAKVAEVRRNLDDARRQFPLLTERSAELAEESRRTVQKLAQALTTDASITSSKEPPLISAAEAPASPKPRPRTPAATSAPAKKVAPALKPAESGGADFEP